jgi:hypothetical protein
MRASSLQYAHRYAHLSKLLAGWHLSHAAPQIEHCASPEQNDFGEHMGLPKGPPLPLCSLV